MDVSDGERLRNVGRGGGVASAEDLFAVRPDFPISGLLKDIGREDSAGRVLVEAEDDQMGALDGSNQDVLKVDAPRSHRDLGGIG